jgi:hypothetical protein
MEISGAGLWVNSDVDNREHPVVKDICFQLGVHTGFGFHTGVPGH